jgi:predicted Zn-dependent protease
MCPRPLAALLAACLALSACAAPPWRDGGGEEAARRAPPSAALDVERGRARAFIEVVQAVEPVAEAECARRNLRANCDFRIVVDDRPGMPPNAFQTLDAAGRPLLAFTLALIGEVQNRDEMAFVVAHEASHHIAGHLTRQAESAALGAAVFGQIATSMSGATPERIRAAQEVGAAVGARSYSKEFELEADALGTRVAVLAGYDPIRGAEFFLRIPDPGNRFLGTHPSNAERIATVARAAAEMGVARSR